MDKASIYSSNLKLLKKQIDSSQKINLDPILKWLNNKRKISKAKVKLVSISSLSDWLYDKSLGIIRHKKGTDKFFSIQGIKINNASTSEVNNWDQPILVQKEGGILAIICQKQGKQIKFLLHAKFEPGNIGKVQLAPTIQATYSNLKRHHGGVKPRFSEYLNYPKTTIIYSSKHNEEGSRFLKKSNINSLVLIDQNETIYLTQDDDYIWLTLPEIKLLFLYDNIVNPFVKTILSPL